MKSGEKQHPGCSSPEKGAKYVTYWKIVLDKKSGEEQPGCCSSPGEKQPRCCFPPEKGVKFVIYWKLVLEKNSGEEQPGCCFSPGRKKRGKTTTPIFSSILVNMKMTPHYSRKMGLMWFVALCCKITSSGLIWHHYGAHIGQKYSWPKIHNPYFLSDSELSNS